MESESEGLDGRTDEVDGEERVGPDLGMRNGGGGSGR